MPVFELTHRSVRWLADFLFGFDFFISYAWKDGSNYPERLARALGDLGYKVCLDKSEYRAGEDLNLLTRRFVRNSNTLVLVARSLALDSKWVLREVQECLDAGRTPVAIDINGTLEKADEASVLKGLLHPRLHIEERLEDPDGSPSDRVIQRLQQRFVGVRQETFRQRVIAGAAAGFAALGAVATWQWREAAHQRDEAAARLVSQRVSNGTRAAIDGDLWGAWSWFANALQLAERSGLNERSHRERLYNLRQQVPHLRQLWRVENAQASIISPDGELIAVFSEGSPATGVEPHIGILSARDGSRLAEIKLGKIYLREMVFAPRGDELWMLHSIYDPVSKTQRSMAAIHELPGGGIKAVREIREEHGRLQWLTERTLALIDSQAVHLVRFQNGTIAVETLPGPPDAYVQAVSADGSLLAAYSYDSRKLLIRHRDSPAANACELDFERSPTVVFGPDGKHLITLDNRKLAVWQLDPTARKVAEEELEGSVTACRIDPNGRLLITEERGDSHLVTTLRRAENGMLLKTFDHERIVARWEFPADPRGAGAGAGTAAGGSITNPFERWVLMSEDGERILTVSKRTRSYRIWDVQSEEALTPPLSHGGMKLHSVRLGRDGRFAVSSAADGVTKLWDVALPRRPRPLIGQPGPVKLLSFLGDGERLLSLSSGRLAIIDWALGKRLAGLDDDLEGAEVAAGGRAIVGWQKDRFRLWSTTALEPVSGWLSHPSMDGVTVSENGLYAASWHRIHDRPSQVRIWDLAQGAMLAEITPGESWLRRVVIDERRRSVLMVLSGQGRGQDLVVHDWKTGKTSRPEEFQGFPFQGIFSSKPMACWIAFDGQRFWRLVPGVGTASRPVSETRSSLTEFLVAGESGTRAILTDREGKIAQVIDVRTGAPLTPEFRHEWKITDAEMGLGAARLLTVSGNRAHLWDLTAGEALVPVIRYPQTVTAAALHPQSRSFVVSTEKSVGDDRFALFVEPLDQETADVESLVAYGEVNGEQRVDATGGRLPLPAEVLDATWSSLQGRAGPVLQPSRSAVDWYRQLEAESGRDLRRKLSHLDRILEIAPEDPSARQKRVDLYLIFGDQQPALAEMVDLAKPGSFEPAIDFPPERIRRWCQFLLLKNRPREAYELLRALAVSSRGFEGWLIALASHGAGEGEAYRRNGEAMLRAAQEIAATDAPPAEKWNAAFYAAHAWLLAKEPLPELGEAVRLAAEAAPDERSMGTLRMLQGAVALKAGDLSSAEASLQGLDRYPLNKVLTAELRFRQGDPASARSLLSEVHSELAKIDGRRPRDVEAVAISYLARELRTAVALQGSHHLPRRPPS